MLKCGDNFTAVTLLETNEGNTEDSKTWQHHHCTDPLRGSYVVGESDDSSRGLLADGIRALELKLLLKLPN